MKRYLQCLALVIVGSGFVGCGSPSYAPEQVTAGADPIVGSELAEAAREIRIRPGGPRKVFESYSKETRCEIHSMDLREVDVPAVGVMYSPTVASNSYARARERYFPHFAGEHPRFSWSKTDIQILKVCPKCFVAHDLWVNEHGVAD